VTRRVFGVVLSLAIHLRSWFLGDAGAMVFGAPAVSIDVLDADRYAVRSPQVSRGFVLAQFPQRDCTIAYVHLHAMISDAQADCESEGCTQPIGCLIHVGVGKNGNDCGAMDGPVGENAAPPWARVHQRFICGVAAALSSAEGWMQ
jgi:hypothetical protein